jgi:hypothetical protein
LRGNDGSRDGWDPLRQQMALHFLHEIALLMDFAPQRSNRRNDERGQREHRRVVDVREIRSRLRDRSDAIGNRPRRRCDHRHCECRPRSHHPRGRRHRNNVKNRQGNYGSGEVIDDADHDDSCHDADDESERRDRFDAPRQKRGIEMHRRRK